MENRDLFLKIYGERIDGQWSLICLNYSLAAQAPTLAEAKATLKSQIKEYLYDAQAGDDKEFAYALLNRRAPLKYWAKWWMCYLLIQIFHKRENGHRSFREPVGMIPA